MNREDVINVKNLKVFFCSRGGILKAVEGIDLEVHKGECVALVGESGCGKTTVGKHNSKFQYNPSVFIDFAKQQLCNNNGKCHYSD